MTILARPESRSSEMPRGDGAGSSVLISVVVPVYREEENIRPFLQRTVPVLERLGDYEIIFCLDPSPDGTERTIREELLRNNRIGLLVFSRKFGQPAATMAGILNCRGRWCVVIDVDLQDPPELIEQLFHKARGGYDVVTARRSSRKGEPLMRRIVAYLGYKLINSIAEVSIPPDTGDFRIMSRRVVEELRGLSESHSFLRGLVPLVGFPQAELVYERHSRHMGSSKYNRFLGSIKIGLNGIIGFSTIPLQLMEWIGFLIAIASAVAIVVVTVLKFVHGSEYPMGMPTITILVLFLSGIQLVAIGVLGEYVGRIYEQVRDRPLYIIDRATNVVVRDRRGPRTGAEPAACYSGTKNTPGAC